jgi:hypothetical protein
MAEEMTGQNVYIDSTQPMDDGTNASAVGWRTMSTYEYSTPHVEGRIEYGKDHKNGIHPRLYFRYVKSKLGIMEMRAFKRQMKQLEKMADEYAQLGQEALSEECIKQFIVLSREAALFACGFKVFLTEEELNKFRHDVRVPVRITPLKNFSRVIPKAAAEKIKMSLVKKLFDEVVIVHIDQKGAIKETEKERITRERDPIAFGRLQYSERYYFIADWEDEHDDLRLSDIIKKLSLKKANMTLKKKIDRKRLPKKDG